MKCEKCGSDNTQRLQVVYESGTSQINTQSHSIGSAGTSDNYGTANFSTSTTGTVQTALGTRAAPPQEKSFKGAGISLLIGFFMLWEGSGWVYMLGFPLIAAGGFFGYKAYLFNKNEWPQQYRFWQGCWLCHKCGSIYHE